METVVLILTKLVDLVVLVLIVDAVLSWVQAPDKFPRRLTHQMTEPMYRPIRRFVPAIAGIDFTPLILIFLLQGISRGIIAVLL